MVEEFHHAVDARPTDQGSWEYAGPGQGDAFAATPQNVAYFLAGTRTEDVKEDVKRSLVKSWNPFA